MSLPEHESHFPAAFALELHSCDSSLPAGAWSNLAAESANGVLPVTSTTRHLDAMSLPANSLTKSYQQTCSSGRGGAGQKKQDRGGRRERSPATCEKNRTGWPGVKTPARERGLFKSPRLLPNSQDGLWDGEGSGYTNICQALKGRGSVSPKWTPQGCQIGGRLDMSWGQTASNGRHTRVGLEEDRADVKHEERGEDVENRFTLRLSAESKEDTGRRTSMLLCLDVLTNQVITRPLITDTFFLSSAVCLRLSRSL